MAGNNPEEEAEVSGVCIVRYSDLALNAVPFIPFSVRWGVKRSSLGFEMITRIPVRYPPCDYACMEWREMCKWP